MANERLRTAIFKQGETLESLAEAVGVDPKTVERWITTGRVPYTRHRWAISQHLNTEVTYLWPASTADQQNLDASESEIVKVHARRGAVSLPRWAQLFSDADDDIGILLFAGGFLFEDTGIRRILADRAGAGVHVRLALGDPDSSVVRARGEEEGAGEALAMRIREYLTLLRPLLDVDGIEIRLHTKTLYTSIFRSDDVVLANPHIYGVRAIDAPLLELQRVAGGALVATYLHSFDQVWDTARPWTGGS